jgi:uncharacterized protein DUF1566
MRAPGVSFFSILVCSLILTGQAEAVKPGTDSGGTVIDLQSWSVVLPASQRFVLLGAFSNEAVLDKQTGLVWEQAPDGTTLRPWEAALDYCLNKGVGSPTFTPGWRLPSVVELNSVRDYSLGPPYVPSIFTNVQASDYWSATTVASNPDGGWEVRFSNGLVTRADKGSNLLAWCVRGPMNADAY